MATFETTRRFERDLDRLSADERAALKRAIEKFVEDLPRGRFRPSLRVKGVKGAPGVFEMTWAQDGRATFQYGDEVKPGHPHVIWRRCGRHVIFDRP